MHDLPGLLKVLFESVDIGIQITDSQGKILQVNNEFCSLFGYSREELLGKNFTFILSSRQRENELQVCNSQVKEDTNESFTGYWHALRKNGEEILVAVFTYFVRLEEGKVFKITFLKDRQSWQNGSQKEFLSSVLNNVEEGVLVSDLSGKVQYWNKRFVDLFNLNEEELPEKSIQTFWPELDLDQFIASFKKEDSHYEIHDLPFTKPNGEKLFIEKRITPFYNERGTLAGIIFLCQDVTKKRRNELELLEQKNLLASLVESQSAFLIRINPKGKLTYTNKAFATYGVCQENPIEKSFKDCLYPPDQAKWLDQFQMLLKKKKVLRVELRIVKENEAIVWTGWEFVVLQDQTGKVTGVQGVGVDVTHRKKIEQERDQLLLRSQAMNEELQANEEELRQNLEKTVELNDYIQKNNRRFKSLLENSFEAIILFDEPGFITYASPSIERTLGYKPEEMVGKKGMSFVHENDKAQSRALLGQMMEKTGNRVYILQRVRKKDGTYIWIESYSTNLLQDENVQGVVSNFRDITDRIESEKKLRNSEASLNLAQYVAKLGSTEFDLITGGITYSSGIFTIYDYDIKKYPKEEFNSAVYLHPDDVHKLQDLFKNSNEFDEQWLKDMANLPREVIEEVESEPFEFRIISAEGRLKYLRSRHRFFTDENGKAVKLILTIQDVSEEEHRERLLDETSQMARIGGWELDPVTNKIYWTPETYRLFEVPPTEDLTVEKAVGFYHPDDQPILQEAVQHLIAEGKAFDLELKMTTATDKEIWVRMMGKSEKVEGKVVLAKGTMQDITDKKEAEREVQEYAERLRLATEAAGFGIWDWDLQKNKMVWDKQMRKLYDIPEDKPEVEFEDYRKVLHPDDVHEQERLLQEVIRNKKLESEFRIISPASEVRWLKSFAKVFDDEAGRPKRMIGVNWDITRLKETEETLLKNNEELLKTNEELDHFVYSTSHNLRAPLTSILGIVNLMKNHPRQTDYFTYINLIEKSVQKLDETIQDITNYSRNTRVEIVLEPVNFESMIQGIVESLSFLENAENIRISYIAPSDSLFFSDSSRLKMIFTNLISNAIKYSDPDKVDPFILIMVEQKKEGAYIRVKDNGIGIGKDHQSKIFNMFFRASSRSTGSGLGLYIVKEAIHKLEGTIEVDSTPGKGTEFTVFLPNQV